MNAQILCRTGLVPVPFAVKKCGQTRGIALPAGNRYHREAGDSGDRTMRIAVGSDHRGVQLRAKLIEYLEQLGQEVVDAGTHEEQPVNYPDIAAAVARKVASREVDRGILVCGTGVGMCIVANKIPGVRAAPATTT